MPNDETNNKPTERELWFEDLKTYRKLETWGVGLVFAGIALITREIAKWKNNPSWILFIPEWVPFIPAIIGLGAFVHLRIINYRGRKVRWQMQPSEVPKSPGLYGLLMAVWPLFLGVASSCFLLKDWNIKIAGFCFLGVIGFLGVILIEEVVYDLKWERWLKRKRGGNFSWKQWLEKNLPCPFKAKPERFNSSEVAKQEFRETLQKHEIPEGKIKEVLAYLDPIKKGFTLSGAHPECLPWMVKQALFSQEGKEITLKIERQEDGYLKIIVLEIE